MFGWCCCCVRVHRFEEACAAYAEGGRPELGLALLQQLADVAVVQCRFADAAQGCYKLAMESLKVCIHWHSPVHSVTALCAHFVNVHLHG